jgi:hypothetical protein
LKCGLDTDFLIRNDFVNQKRHPKSEKEGDEIFQDEPNDRHHIEKRPNAVTLDKGDPRGNQHTDEQENSNQENHEKIDSLPTKDASTRLNLKDDIQGCS